MKSPPVVYLDTQDYSRFGDVLRGKSDVATETLFVGLQAREQAGDAIFAVSMPVLGELLQYDAAYRDTTIKKAQAVECLCRGWALAYPSRLVAAEIAHAMKRRGVLPDSQDTTVLSSDRYWYPNVADAFDGFHAKMKAALEEELGGLQLSRKLRRGTAKHARKLDFHKVAREAAPEMAAEYGLPVGVITGSIVALLSGRISSEEASRRLFSAIAKPVKFVETYFEKVESDRSLPKWISETGAGFHTRFVQMRENLQPFMHLDSAKAQLEAMLPQAARTFAEATLRLGLSDTEEFGLDPMVQDAVARDPTLPAEIEACKIVSAILPAYLRQIMGLAGPESKIERSFGGDLIHALYLPHVDLWRGDRRFSALLRDAAPSYADRIVPALKDLPNAIDRWHADHR